MEENNPISTKDLQQIVDDHSQWLRHWTRAVCFPESLGDDVAPILPGSFTAWWERVADNPLVQQPAFAKLPGIYELMAKQSAALLQLAIKGQRPSLAQYDQTLGNYQDFISFLRRLEKALGALDAGIDTLTGLPSRARMRDDLERELNRFRRGGVPFCVAICDIDHFKAINDTYGHDGGDRVLVHVAGILQRSVRNFDDVYRFGGEEFIISLKNADIGDGQVVLERLRSEVQHTALKLSSGQPVGVTVSFGLARATRSENVDQMLERADLALYEAKRNGRNQVVAAPTPATMEKIKGQL